jgi:hypothetical protein
MMADYLLLFIGTVLVNNFVLVKFLGLCPFMGVSKKLETAMGMGLATTFVMTLASICAWLIDTWILIPLNLVCVRWPLFWLSPWWCSLPRWWCVKPARPVSPAGYFLTADHHQLCRARRRAAEY